MKECKFCDDFTGVCCDPECPMRGDCCPVSDIEGLCKHEQRYDEEETWTLTPRGCAACALMDAGLIKSYDDPAADLFFDKFQELMKSVAISRRNPDGKHKKIRLL